MHELTLPLTLPSLEWKIRANFLPPPRLPPPCLPTSSLFPLPQTPFPFLLLLLSCTPLFLLSSDLTILL